MDRESIGHLCRVAAALRAESKSGGAMPWERQDAAARSDARVDTGAAAARRQRIRKAKKATGNAHRILPSRRITRRQPNCMKGNKYFSKSVRLLYRLFQNTVKVKMRSTRRPLFRAVDTSSA